jgi:hypothetical protein
MANGRLDDLNCCGGGDWTMNINEAAVGSVGSNSSVDADRHDDVGHRLLDFFFPRILLGKE